MSYRIVDVIKMEPTKKIEVSGWIRSFRANKFISLNDGSCMTSLQVVIDPDNFDTKTIKRLAKKYISTLKAGGDGFRSKFVLIPLAEMFLPKNLSKSMQQRIVK